MFGALTLSLMNAGCGFDLPEGKFLSFKDLSGWDKEDHQLILKEFQRFCKFRQTKDEKKLETLNLTRPGQDLREACESALKLTPSSSQEAKVFFETHFRPYEVFAKSQNQQEKGLMTGYYEPEFLGSLTPNDEFRYPLYSRPEHYFAPEKGVAIPGLPRHLTSAKRIVKDGREIYEAWPSRENIEKGALKDDIKPLVYLKEPGHTFIIHVQGSARIVLPDHSSLRVAFAGRNGYTYSSIGKVLVEKGEIPLEHMSLERLLNWLRDHPDRAQEIMNHNESFIFFRIADELKNAEGPVGGAGLPLTPMRSIAIDHVLWSYGLPVWLEGTIPQGKISQQHTLNRLVLALDTGAAIKGPARVDFFWGSGEKAGSYAGITKQKVRFIVFLPHPSQ